nr:MAG TPA: hypothetical protein [Caudoviricetes sp.]
MILGGFVRNDQKRFFLRFFLGAFDLVLLQT